MKNIHLAITGTIIVVLLIFVTCSKDLTTPQSLSFEKSIQEKYEINKTEEYWANLRAYKKSKHEIVFGWFGDWSTSNPSRLGRLSALPDSVDIVSFWSGDNSNKEEDMKIFREQRGGRILSTFFPVIIDRSEEEMKTYGELLAKTNIEKGFDGLDIDWEPGFVSNTMSDNFITLVKILGKYFGPISGTGKLLTVNGELSSIPPETIKYFDYAIAQAYSTSDPDELQYRYDDIEDMFTPGQFIVTENIGDYYETGGIDYTDPEYGVVPSLIGMAYWEPIQGKKAGIGAFRIEKLYRRDGSYDFLRQAIQIMNPANLENK